MKKLVVFISITISFIQAYPQYDISEYFADTTQQGYTLESDVPSEQPKKVDFHLGTGMSFTSFQGSGNMYTNYIAPEWSYRFTPRFNVNFGTAIIRQSYNNIPNFYFMNDESSLSGSYNTAFIYAEGEYQLTKRITVSGMGYKEVPLTKKPAHNPYLFSYLNQGMAMEINYQITDNMNIGATITIQDGASPYSPYYNNYISPFGYSSTNRGFMNPW